MSKAGKRLIRAAQEALEIAKGEVHPSTYKVHISNHVDAGDYQEEKTMANVYVEARPKGRTEGEPIEDYVVEDHANGVLHTAKTQAEAIDWAKAQGHKPLVARVRHLNDKAKPDHWRSV